MWILSFIIVSVISSTIFYMLISVFEKGVEKSKRQSLDRRNYNPPPIIINNYIPAQQQYAPQEQEDLDEYNNQLDSIQSRSQGLCDDIRAAEIAINREEVGLKYEELHDSQEETVEYDNNVVNFNSFRRKNG